MKGAALLLCLLGSAQALPKQLSAAPGASPTKPPPDRVTPLTTQQPSPVFPSLSLIPLAQLLALGSDLQLLTPAPGVAPGAQKLPLTLGAPDGQAQRPPQVLPIFVAQVGTQAALLSSEELPLAPQIFAGLLLHSLLPGGVLAPGQAGPDPDAQDGPRPAGQAGANTPTQAAPEGRPPTAGVTDDDYEATTGAGVPRATPTATGAAAGAPRGTH